MKSTWLKFGAVGTLGLLAPVWWTWAASQLIYALYVASGAPERANRGLLWGTVYAPSLALGLLTGVIVAVVMAGAPLRGWATFIGSLVIGALLTGAIVGSPEEYVGSLFSSVGNWFFLAGSAIWPVVAWNRRRAG